MELLSKRVKLNCYYKEEILINISEKENKMTLMLKNTGEKSSLTLRYGDGLNKAIQILPGKQVELPTEMSKKLIQSYLSLFKDLKIIEVKKGEKKSEVDKEGSKKDSTTGQNTKDTSKQDDVSKNEANTESGSIQKDDNTNSKSNEGELENENQSLGGQSHSVQNSKSTDGQKDSGSDGDVSDNNQTQGENTAGSVLVQYTAKELKAKSPDEIKEIAKNLGIDINAPETNSKKELIAVILNKQENK